MAESMRFDITGRDVGGSATLKGLARDSDVAATQTRRLADAMDAQRRAAATSAAATLASAKADKIWKDAQDDAIAATVKQRIETDKLKTSAAETAGKNGLGLLTQSANLTTAGWGALIGAGVALTPVIATLGTGLGALGLAAVGMKKEILAGSGAFAGLKAEYKSLQMALKPTILKDFNAAIGAARPLLAEVEPVAKATGNALAVLLDDVGKTFQSGEFKQFFQFMGSTAAGDMRYLDQTLINLLKTLPPLAKELQPVATDLLAITSATTKLTQSAVSASGGIDKQVQHENVLAQTTDMLRTVLFAPGVGLYQALKLVGVISSDTGSKQRDMAAAVHQSGQAASDLMKQTITTVTPMDRLGRATATASFTVAEYGKNANLTVTPADRLGRVADVSAASIGHVATAADFANIKIIDVRNSVKSLTTALSKGLDPLVNYSNALLTQQGDAKNLADALKASGNQIGFRTQKQRDSFSAANTYIKDLENTAQQALASHQGIGKEISSLENSLPALEHAQSHSKLYWQEVRTLISYLDKLRAEKRIREAVTVFGSGTWSLSQPGGKLAGPTGTATGWLVSGGSPGKDSVPIMAMPGELVVPTKMVAAGLVDHLRGAIPGFASGGIVSKYSGAVAGLPPWIGHNQQASISAITAGIANAFASSFKAMFSRGAAGAGPARHASMPWLERLWDAAGGPPGVAHLMAAIAMAESGGSPIARNPSGASGLWQILGLPFPGNPFDPLTNARMAVAKYESQGLGAWVTYTNGAYRQFYGNGLRGGIFTRPTPIVVGDKQPERVDVTPVGRPGGQGGAMVNIENYHSHHDADPYILSQQISFRIVAAALS